ncbi:spermidine synthase [Edaphobacter bradus]|uniref:spermidine synthase n=1 Tax=Edaphobacter bradus TaxID=2259016 RepID=UPI0021DFE1AD|nr:fused MFS/spermidine synthase [Edaphobacter bradus]
MRSSRLLYGTVAALSAFLLFAVEPIAARQLLPGLGGSSAVWITCLVFFQAVLLAGYLYAHWVSRLAAGAQRGVHLALLAAAAIQTILSEALRPGTAGGATHPVATVFVFLTLTIGLPFLLLASTSPLLQLWLYRSESLMSTNERGVWYRLFALSNAGSLLALLAYPSLIEPHLTLYHQRVLWRLGFVVFAVSSALLLTKIRAAAAVAAKGAVEAPPASTRQKWLWFLLPMAAAMQLSSVTSHLTMNIAAIPLLWVLPLAVYLVTFIAAFERPSLYRRGVVTRLLIVMLASLGYALSKADFSLPIDLSILFFLLECFVACFFCHAEAYALRPQRASQTTLFYLLVAAGGAAGTFFIGIACPLLFAANYDLALAFLATAALALVVTWNDGRTQRLLWATGTVLLLALALMLRTVYSRQALVETRNFYGSLRVTQKDMPEQHVPIRTLLNGAIQHGSQIFAPEFDRLPTTYYAKDSGVGLVLRHCCDGRARHVGVVGLGAGTLAVYGRPGDRFRFYELNPAVRPIAQNLFTYLRDSSASITFAEGDARTSLAGEPPQGFDVFVVDAFSGDAIPLHLLTTQALELYRRHLAPGGVLAFHVSNQYLDLAPELAQLADAASMQARAIDTQPNEVNGEFRAEWILMTADPAFFLKPEIAAAATPIAPQPGVRPWTDDYSSLLPVLRLVSH